MQLDDVRARHRLIVGGLPAHAQETALPGAVITRVAKRFVRFAGEAAKKAAVAPKSVPGQKAAAMAVKAAAKKHGFSLNELVGAARLAEPREDGG